MAGKSKTKKKVAAKGKAWRRRVPAPSEGQKAGLEEEAQTRPQKALKAVVKKVVKPTAKEEIEAGGQKSNRI